MSTADEDAAGVALHERGVVRILRYDGYVENPRRV